MQEIYLDNGATTRPSDGVIAKMTEAMAQAYGNPSSLHRKGQQAEKYVEEARKIIAQYLGVDPTTLYFTSGGTECSNTAILGAAQRNLRRGKHILTVRGEHPATSEPLKLLASQGYEVEYVENDEQGKVCLESLKEKLRPDTILVTCLHVNNETGVIQPIEAMGKIIKEGNPETLFHVDAVQSFAKLPVKPVEWKVDFLSSSAHKFHGPKGIGCLYIRRGLTVQPFIRGGGQEKKMRSGTENVPGIAGMGQAVKEAMEDLQGHTQQVQHLKMHLYQQIINKIPDVKVNGPTPEDGAAHVLNLQFLNVRSEVLLHSLEDYGIFISSGSACASNKPEEKSPALSAIGLNRNEMDQSVRFSFSRYNTMEEMDQTAEALAKVVPMLRRYVRRNR
ncbi:MAG: cysteine desulfurase [Firmicutes bacterium]|nr:cysteine desulfurase [Bacillota bacterium]